VTAIATATDPRSWSDAHLHAWDATELAAPWFAQASPFAGRFDLARYASEGGVGGGVVFVEAAMAARDRVREAELFASGAQQARRAFATVAGVEPGVAGFF
jgi:predicted TIM-barrel fold metal-dependent hydrolase